MTRPVQHRLVQEYMPGYLSEHIFLIRKVSIDQTVEAHPEGAGSPDYEFVQVGPATLIIEAEVLTTRVYEAPRKGRRHARKAT